MAKEKHSVNAKGFLDWDEGTITEVTKDEEKTYDLHGILRRFNGKYVTISISEDKDIDPIE